MNPKMQELRKKAMALPLLPGVYIMHDKSGEIIYIGKAKALKNRVSQYFGSQNNHAEKVRRMVDNVDDFEYIITDSEFEALILECSLIKQHTPKYNILLKDDKGYSYIRVSSGDWGRITYVLQKKDDGAQYIGPYKSSYYVKSAVEEANKIFMLPTCNRRFPQDFRKGRPCLNYHIKQCMAPCTGRVKLKDYKESLAQALAFLKGGSSNSIKQLTAQMEDAAENLEFERAARIRDKINAVKKMGEKQKVVANKVLDEDVIASFTDDGKICFQVFRFEGGRLFDRESFIFDSGDSESEYEEFLLSYYTIRNDVPKNIALDKEFDGIEAIAQWLSEKRGNKVNVTVPQRGEQAQLVSMCRSNAAEALAQKKGATVREYGVLEELKETLGLEKLPEYIESYDISNLAGTENVAGMIVYKNGKSLKSAYKKFKIKGFEGQDDYASMAEVITRRFDEYYKAEDKTEGFGKLPDLILLDGGKGQVAAVKQVLERMNIDVPLFGMVKDDKHRTRAVTGDGGEIAISSKRALFTFLSKMQDEVHRFAIGYHHARRSKNTFKSSLTNIDGVGEVRAKSLLKYFRTIDNISKADLTELENAPKMTKDSALAVYRYFHTEDEGQTER
ncbi:excinuclease ABC subunit UvrC [Ruminococcus sp.]|uniref:excinuclease ABC subunit UvrC n=1 Tax=Ruminococcus sp. TaxID=41978 RepID=UPI0026207E60|nr:excinuclease ABC subunit UvrC [Ruminococcus sp.]MDD6988474.1 excinuclease ABC subunit UvrC [Ruminococcus sp.]MDY6200787.1 excinuclease ABC subunit UvrC [Ruminococcus sp.]